MTKNEVVKIVKEVLAEENRKIEKLDTFKKVELMLRHYNSFLKRISLLNEELKNIVIKKGTSFGGVQSRPYEYLSEIEKIEIRKLEIEEQIYKYKKITFMIEEAITKISDDKYFEIIPLKYFQCYTNESIAEKLYIDRATYFRNRNRLINLLVEFLFPEEIIKKICD